MRFGSCEVHNFITPYEYDQIKFSKHSLESLGPSYSLENSPFLKIFSVGYPETPYLLQESFPFSVQSTYRL